MISFICFILWVISVNMMFIDFHWGWLVSFIITSLYFMIHFGRGLGNIDFDIGD